jgi:antitoxin HigA-1
MGTKKRFPSHPGSILKLHYLEPTGISVTELAKELRLSRKTVSKILNGRGGVTTDVALRLSRAFDTTPELWLNLQRDFDLWRTANETTDWQAIRPILKMARGGTLSGLSSRNVAAGESRMNLNQFPNHREKM